MNILRIIASMNPAHGGPSQGIRNSIPAMEKLGACNEVLCFDTPEAPFLNNDPFPIHAIGPAKGPYAYCKNLRPWMLRNLHRFDAIIIHGLWLYNSYGTYKVWKKYKKHHAHAPKLYLMPHGMLDPYFQQAKDRKFKALRNQIFWKLIEQRVVNNIDGLLFTCEQELLLARQPFRPYRPKKEVNVGYGIEAPPPNKPSLREAFLSQCPVLKEQPYWLFMGRIHPKKGTDFLINAYLILKLTYPKLPLLVIAGPGLESNLGRRLLKVAGEDPDILFPGMLTGDAKWGALYGCDAFIIPSHQENFGISIVEAMACGKPVLITNKVNICQEIITGGGGLVGEDTEEATYLSLKTWHEFKKEKKEAMASAAKKTFESRFAIHIAAANLINILKETP